MYTQDGWSVFFRIGSKQDPKVTVICTRSEIPLVKKLVFENGKKIYYDSVASAVLFHNYRAGKEIEPKDFKYIIHYYANFLYHFNQSKRTRTR